jgi:hypothetical protein
MQAVRVAMKAMELYENLNGEMTPEERLLLRARLVEQALRLLEKGGSREA